VKKEKQEILPEILILKPMPHIATFKCCFRELIDLWRDNNLCEVKYITEIKSTGSDTTLDRKSVV
jgi:hypothetical protein